MSGGRGAPLDLDRVRDALPEALTVPEVGKRFRCGSCGAKRVSTRPAWHTAKRSGVPAVGSKKQQIG
jgi:hypothetical protein